jgi:hypothetical protein
VQRIQQWNGVCSPRLLQHDSGQSVFYELQLRNWRTGRAVRDCVAVTEAGTNDAASRHLSDVNSKQSTEVT